MNDLLTFKMIRLAGSLRMCGMSQQAQEVDEAVKMIHDFATSCLDIVERHDQMGGDGVDARTAKRSLQKWGFLS